MQRSKQTIGAVCDICMCEPWTLKAFLLRPTRNALSIKFWVPACFLRVPRVFLHAAKLVLLSESNSWSCILVFFLRVRLSEYKSVQWNITLHMKGDDGLEKTHRHESADLDHGSWPHRMLFVVLKDWGESNKESSFPKNSGEPPLSCQHIGKLPISQSVWLELNGKPEEFVSAKSFERSDNPEIDETYSWSNKWMKMR